MIAAWFCSSRAKKATRRAHPIFAPLFAAGATLFSTCGAAAPALGGEAPRAGLPAPSALHGIKIDTSESALDLKRTEALLATYLCPIEDYLAEITRKTMAPRGRFLIVWARGRDEYYVQCLFFDDDRQIRREGASGYYYDEIKGYMTAAKGEVLAELARIRRMTR